MVASLGVTNGGFGAIVPPFRAGGGLGTAGRRKTLAFGTGAAFTYPGGGPGGGVGMSLALTALGGVFGAKLPGFLAGVFGAASSEGLACASWPLLKARALILAFVTR